MSNKLFSIFSNKNDARLGKTMSDFVIRDRIPAWQVLAMMFVAVAMVSVALGLLVNDIVVFTTIIFVMLVVVGTYVVLLLQNSRDLVLATEFQNAIFSSALASGDKFCLIMRNDGTVTYITPALQELFPNFMRETSHSVESLLELAQVSKEQQKIVFSEIGQKTKEKIIFDMVDFKKRSHRLVMSLEPIARPRGFLILRGREFVEKREIVNPISDNSMSSLFNRTNFNFLSYVTDTMNVGAYITDMLGNIIYANPNLEKWLCYDEDEIASRTLSLKDLISANRSDIFKNGIGDFEGEVQLQIKTGGSIGVFLNQKTMYGAQDAVVGYVAFIHLLGDVNVNFPDNKKNSW